MIVDFFDKNGEKKYEVRNSSVKEYENLLTLLTHDYMEHRFFKSHVGDDFMITVTSKKPSVMYPTKPGDVYISNFCSRSALAKFSIYFFVEGNKAYKYEVSDSFDLITNGLVDVDAYGLCTFVYIGRLYKKHCSKKLNLKVKEVLDAYKPEMAKDCLVGDMNDYADMVKKMLEPFCSYIY